MKEKPTIIKLRSVGYTEEIITLIKENSNRNSNFLKKSEKNNASVLYHLIEECFNKIKLNDLQKNQFLITSLKTISNNIMNILSENVIKKSLKTLEKKKIILIKKLKDSDFVLISINFKNIQSIFLKKTGQSIEFSGFDIFNENISNFFLNLKQNSSQKGVFND